MADWKHEQGYKEPEECGFCAQFFDYVGRPDKGVCLRGFDGNPHHRDGAQIAWFREHKCHARGTCRYFRRK